VKNAAAVPKQSGVALITVLLVVAIAMVVTAGMIARQQLSIQSNSNQMSARQAWHYALGGEILAQAILTRDLKQSGSNPREPIDHPREAWARQLPPFDIDQGSVSVQIEDLSGRFNLNSLMLNGQPNALALQRFQRLLLRLQIDPLVADRLLDWLDENQLAASAGGAEDNEYLLLQPAYRAANRPLQDISELRLLLDLSAADFNRLQAYVSALPAEVALNVNTASALVLSTLADNLSPEAALELVKARGPDGYRSLAAFSAQPALAGMGDLGGNLTLGSQYFQARSEVQVGERRRVLTSLLRREPDGRVLVLQRDLGQAARVLQTDNKTKEQP
jgi:general secretion pathway protein K